MKKTISLWRYLCAAILTVTLGVTQVWADDSQDTYYKFAATADPGATIAPTSGNGGNITLGSNSAAKVTATSANYLGNSYSYAANIGNAIEKGFSLNINAGVENPAHIYLVIVASSNRTFYLHNGTESVSSFDSRGTANSASLVELIAASSGSFTIYASGNATVHAVRVVYEKNALWQSLKNSSTIVLDSDKTIADDLGSLLFFRVNTLTFNNDGVMESGTQSNMLFSINFIALQDGDVTLNCANPGSTARTLTVKELTRPGTLGGTAVYTKVMTKSSSDYVDCTFSVEAGKEYVAGFNGTGATFKSATFVADGPATYSLSWNLGGGSVDVAGTAEGSYAAGTAITAPTVSKTGYTFNGWNPEVPATMPAANSEYTAQWTVNTHKLTWNFGGGNTSSTTYTEGGDAIAYGTTITYPADNTMTKSGFDFAGWSTSVTSMPDADLTITAQWAVHCDASAPGDISKGTATGGTGQITLTAEGEAVDGDTWYWQTSEDGTDKTNSGSTFEVNAAGTYYVRSYNTANDCWNGIAKSIEVVAEDLLTAISPSLSYESQVIIGNTLNPTLTGNDGEGAVSYALNNVSPAGCMTINAETGVVTAVAAGTATVTATIAANGYYKGNTATSGTITVTYPATGATTIQYNVAVGTSQTTLATSSMGSNSSSITNLVGFTAAGSLATRSGGGKDNSSPKLETPASKDLAKYVYVTFDVADGYEFVLDSVVTKMVAVSKPKTIEIVMNDENGTKDSLYYEQTNNNDPGDVHKFDFTNSAKIYSGTVTLKIYAYGADANDYRIGKPLKVCGTVAVAMPKAETPTISSQPADADYDNINEVEALTVDASVSDGGTLSYQWYKAGTPATQVGTNSASYTPTAAGTYYVVVTNTLENHSPASVTSNNATVTIPTYTVAYKDENGTTSLGSETVCVGAHPTAAGITPSKSLYVFANWLDNKDAIVDLATISGAADETITLKASYEKVYGLNIDFEDFIDDNNTSGDWGKYLTDNNYAISSTTGVSLDAPENKPADKGLKIKNEGAELSFNVQAGKMVTLKTGVLSGAQISKDGGTNYADLTGATGSTGASVVSYHRNADEALYKIKATVVAYNIIQAITITDPFTITCNDADNGSVVADKVNAIPGETITLTITPALGYQIATLTVNGDAVSITNSEATFTMPAANVTVSATFSAIDYTVTMAQEGGAGATISGNQNNKHYGDEITVTAEEVAGYNFVGWSASPAVTFANDKALSTTFTMPNSDVTITATFSAIDYTVTCSAAEHGSVVAKIGEDPVAKANVGQVVTLTITSDAEYKLGTLTVKDASDEAVEVSNNQFTMPASNVTITATFVDVATSLDNTEAGAKAVKRLENGIVIIEKAGKTYNVMGQAIK